MNQWNSKLLAEELLTNNILLNKCDKRKSETVAVEQEPQQRRQPVQK